jgi:P-type conjugative transfer ATPase TrbB
MALQVLHPVIRARLDEKLRRALGTLMLRALEDGADVIEVMRNHGGEIVVERHGHGLEAVGTMSDLEAEELIGTVAALNHRVANDKNPILEAELPISRARFTGVLPPVTPTPVISIRKPAPVVYTLEDYLAAGVMTARQAETLASAARVRRNILIAGPTASGKTTLASALLAEFDPSHRTVILEDLAELRCQHPHTVYLHTSEAADLLRLLRTTMRLRPDRIVIGELRGAEALTLLKAWNTGHPGGLTTIHAAGPESALIRLETLVQEANVPPQPRLICEAVDLVVSIAQTPAGRRLTGIAAVDGHDQKSGFRLRRIEDCN